MNVNVCNSLIFPLRIAQEIGENEGTACGRSDSAAENKKGTACGCSDSAAENKKELPVAVPIAQRRTKISSLFLINCPSLPQCCGGAGWFCNS